MEFTWTEYRETITNGYLKPPSGTSQGKLVRFRGEQKDTGVELFPVKLIAPCKHIFEGGGVMEAVESLFQTMRGPLDGGMADLGKFRRD